MQHQKDNQVDKIIKQTQLSKGAMPEALESVLHFEELGKILGGKNEESNENNTETLTGLGSIGALCWC